MPLIPSDNFLMGFEMMPGRLNIKVNEISVSTVNMIVSQSLALSAVSLREVIFTKDGHFIQVKYLTE